MSSDSRQVNRALVGVLAIACLIGAFVVYLFDSWENIWCGSFVRVGLLLGAFWLGLPSKGRAAAWADVSPWWIFGFAGAMLFVVRRPRVLIPMIIVIAFLAYVVPMLTGANRRRR